jgi:hypothetical protein
MRGVHAVAPTRSMTRRPLMRSNDRVRLRDVGRYAIIVAGHGSSFLLEGRRATSARPSSFSKITLRNRLETLLTTWSRSDIL